MNDTRHIALLIDIDNVEVSQDDFNEILGTLKATGNVDYVKIYGYNERRHVNWGDTIAFYGFDTCSTMRFRKRNKKQLDLRMVVDAMKINFTKPNIDTFCIVAGNGDLVPLLTQLRLDGKEIIGFARFGSEISSHLFTERLALLCETDPHRQFKKKYGSILQEYSEQTATMALDDKVDPDERDELIAKVEQTILDMQEDRVDDEFGNEDEKFLVEGLENILEILKSF